MKRTIKGLWLLIALAIGNAAGAVAGFWCAARDQLRHR